MRKYQFFILITIMLTLTEKVSADWCCPDVARCTIIPGIKDDNGEDAGGKEAGQLGGGRLHQYVYNAGYASCYPKEFTIEESQRKCSEEFPALCKPTGWSYQPSITGDRCQVSIWQNKCETPGKLEPLTPGNDCFKNQQACVSGGCEGFITPEARAQCAKGGPAGKEVPCFNACILDQKAGRCNRSGAPCKNPLTGQDYPW